MQLWIAAGLAAVSLSAIAYYVEQAFRELDTIAHRPDFPAVVAVGVGLPWEFGVLLLCAIGLAAASGVEMLIARFTQSRARAKAPADGPGP